MEAMHRYNYKSLLFFMLLIMTFSCAKKQAHEEFIGTQESIYVGKVQSVKVENGIGKVTAEWQVPPDPNISNFRIFWNNKKDSLNVNFERSKLLDNLVEVEISPLRSGNYFFEIYSLDLNGRRSVKTEFLGISYPEGYEL